MTDRDPVNKVSGPLAEKYGITDVRGFQSAPFHWTTEGQQRNLKRPGNQPSGIGTQK